MALGEFAVSMQTYGQLDKSFPWTEKKNIKSQRKERKEA